MLSHLVLSRDSGSSHASIATRLIDCPHGGVDTPGLYAHYEYLQTQGEPSAFADMINHDGIGADRSGSNLAFALKVLPGISRQRCIKRTDGRPTQLAAARA